MFLVKFGIGMVIFEESLIDCSGVAEFAHFEEALGFAFEAFVVVRIPFEQLITDLYALLLSLIHI